MVKLLAEDCDVRSERRDGESVVPAIIVIGERREYI
jgi:hypothetical protein